MLEPGQTGYRDDVLKLKALGTRNILFSASTQDAARFVNDLNTTDKTDRFHWYLSPPLETPVLLENTYKGALEGAEGIGIQVLQRRRGVHRSIPFPLERHPYGRRLFLLRRLVALLALALERTVLAEDGKIPNDTLQEMIRATVKPQGVQISWDTLADGMEQLKDGNTIITWGSPAGWYSKTASRSSPPMKIWRIEENQFVPTDEI